MHLESREIPRNVIQNVVEGICMFFPCRCRHMNSSRWLAIIVLCTPCIALNLLLQFFHMHSTWLVVQPVFGSTKFSVWLTVRCWYGGTTLRLTMPLYAAHWSEQTILPGSIWRWMRGSSVAADLSSTMMMNPLLVSGSTPPNTHRSGTRWPMLYFRLATSDSSISTLRFMPPIRNGCSRREREVTSRK